MFVVHRFEQSQGPWHAYGKAAVDSFCERQRLAVVFQKQLGIRGSRGGFASVIGVYLLSIPYQCNGPTTNSTRLWFDQRQNQLHGNRRIDRRASGADDLVSDFNRDWMRCRNREGGGSPTGFWCVASCRLRLFGDCSEVIAWINCRRRKSPARSQCKKGC